MKDFPFSFGDHVGLFPMHIRVSFVKTHFSAHLSLIGGYFICGKVRSLSKTVTPFYVNLKWISLTFSLWKTPVEKPVEIVEKFGFSTAKPPFSIRTSLGLSEYENEYFHP